MKDIYCEQCGLYLFSTDKPDGADGAEAVQKGFVYKMPFFYGIFDGHFFCCKDHWNRWLNDHTTPEQRERGNKEVAEMKQKMEASKPGLLAGLQRIQKAHRELLKMADK